MLDATSIQHGPKDGSVSPFSLDYYLQQQL